jgi:predicted short-subunit dehydrogenase-like oxidoreductase (DUF2520 family)
MTFDKTSKIAFVGSGAVGKTIAVALSRQGYPVVASASRTFASAQDLAGRIEGCVAYESIQDAADKADFVFITSFDGVIKTIADSINWRADQGVAHCSGVTSLDVFEGPVALGAEVGSLHPLQAFASVETALEALPGSTFGIEGAGDVQTYLTQVATDLGGNPISLRSEDKPLYHASVVMIGGVLMGQAALIAQVWEDRFGVPRNEANSSLMPILKGVADILATNGYPAGIAGPYVRGDVGTVKKHLDSMKSVSVEALQMYATSALAGLPFALEKGVADPADAKEIERLLKEYIADNPIT